jgi:hypothetical protein
MKKFILLFLILIFLLFNLTLSTFAANIFKEGVYLLSNLNVMPKNRYTIQNISPDNSVYIAFFDEEQHQIQSIHLQPKSKNYSLIPLEPSYRKRSSNYCLNDTL